MQTISSGQATALPIVDPTNEALGPSQCRWSRRLLGQRSCLHLLHLVSRLRLPSIFISTFHRRLTDGSFSYAWHKDIFQSPTYRRSLSEEAKGVARSQDQLSCILRLGMRSNAAHHYRYTQVGMLVLIKWLTLHY